VVAELQNKNRKHQFVAGNVVAAAL